MARKKVMFWLALQIVFLLAFLIGYAGLKTGSATLNIMPVPAENYILMGFSVLGMLNSLFRML